MKNNRIANSYGICEEKSNIVGPINKLSGIYPDRPNSFCTKFIQNADSFMPMNQSSYEPWGYIQTPHKNRINFPQQKHIYQTEYINPQHFCQEHIPSYPEPEDIRRLTETTLTKHKSFKRKFKFN